MKQFKTESKKMLDMMINSIYTNREIFVRELLSNSSDAIDKLYYNTLTKGISGFARGDFEILIDIDKQARTLTFSDNGIGMTSDELEKNLGTIAKSGSLDFKQNSKEQEDINIIGQFGVGFYSCFMVSDCVEVYSKAYGESTGHLWKSKGVEGYEISECDLEKNGTKIVLHIKANSPDDDYDEFLQEYRIRELIKKYSNYIRYPIKMLVTKYKGENNDQEYTQLETINDMLPLWKKQKSQIKQEEYDELYKNMFYDVEAPLKTIHTSAEGAVEYKALLFIPTKAPYNYYSKNFEKGLKLYTNGVLITDKCADLLPDHFSFVKGLVDSELSLNVSRETIQHDRQLKAIEKNLEKKIKAELVSLMTNNREDYEKFFASFGMQLKYSINSSWGMNKEMLQDLLLFYSAKQDKMVSIDEYISNMPESQQAIYYANGNNVQAVKNLPQAEKVLEEGYDILCMTDYIDEFVIKTIGDYKGKQFSSIERQADNEDKELEQGQDKEIIDFVKQSLEGRVEKVKLSTRLKSHAVCLSSEGDLSIEMEKVFAQMPDSADKNFKAKKVLEINANHPIYQKAKEYFEKDKDSLKVLSEIMLEQAMLIQGLEVDNQTKLSDNIFKLIANN